MVQNFVQTYLIKDFYSLEIHIKETGCEYRLIYLKRQGTKLNLVTQEIYGNEEIFTHLKKDIPLIVLFSGKRIINKVVPHEDNYLQKIIFNKDPDDYYVQEYLKEEKILISIARKKDIDEILDKFKNNNFNIIDFALGPFVLECLAPFLGERKIFATSDLEYDPFENKLTSREIDGSFDLENYTVGEDKILNKHILAFAGYLSHLTPQSFIKSFQSTIDKEAESFSFKIAFSVLAKTILVIFLLLLSISYMTRSYYIGKSSEIQQEAIIHSQVLDQIVTLKKDRDYKKNIISNSSLGSSNKLSFYIFQIASGLPEEILLERFEIFPTQASSKQNEKIIIKPDIIIIEGVTASNLSVNQWVEILNGYGWVEKVELLSYAFEKNEYLFKLNLTL